MHVVVYDRQLFLAQRKLHRLLLQVDCKVNSESFDMPAGTRLAIFFSAILSESFSASVAGAMKKLSVGSTKSRK